MIGLVVAGVLILLAATGVVVTSAFNRSNSYAVGSCVKRGGSQEAVPVDCKEAGSFTVVSKESKVDDCADKAQPYVVVERRSGKDEVLCLKPTEQK
ncbi:hypothetical protein Val02_41430 [Virgisporangium aliadipatigenens]|uniref:Uncharacterized protein n=1 Tax=Virgisporangium aliadipatigenens TaxID=741659 RepID=A0A8J3YMZ4_9ACTN|nr:hypothetical protein Val02_41430 [Virgisporangium aliadipatigenens]